MTYGSLFAGIGGMDLGLERAGMTCKWQVEIDPFARRVLAKHWPDVRRHDDVKTFPPGNLEDWRVDLVAGGFPCQDISYAGKGAGLKGERSGLWYQFARIIGVLRPRFVLVENVAALLVRGLDAVLGTLASFGFDAIWSSLSACSMGAPHTRERLFIVAYPAGSMGRKGMGFGRHGERSQAIQLDGLRECRERWLDSLVRTGGVTDGVPHRMDRIGRCGNAVVPHVAEWIGRRILESTNQ